MVLLLIACCGSAALAVAQSGEKAAAQTHEILISGFKYQPETVTVRVGDTVQWNNGDIVPHTVVAANGSFKSGQIEPGATWKTVLKKSGTFAYTCEPHPNMHGELVVQ
jgi:plastocyanin